MPIAVTGPKVRKAPKTPARVTRRAAITVTPLATIGGVASGIASRSASWADSRRLSLSPYREISSRQ